MDPSRALSGIRSFGPSRQTARRTVRARRNPAGLLAGPQADRQFLHRVAGHVRDGDDALFREILRARDVRCALYVLRAVRGLCVDPGGGQAGLVSWCRAINGDGVDDPRDDGLHSADRVCARSDRNAPPSACGLRVRRSGDGICARGRLVWPLDLPVWPAVLRHSLDLPEQ